MNEKPTAPLTEKPIEDKPDLAKVFRDIEESAGYIADAIENGDAVKGMTAGALFVAALEALPEDLRDVVARAVRYPEDSAR